jgi:hypothetical protein
MCLTRPAGRRGTCAERRHLGAHLVLAHDARFDVSHQRRDLTLAGLAGAPPGAGEAVPSAREAAEVGAPAASVRGEHRANASAAVAVGADDDPVVALKALEHRDARLVRQAFDDVA